MDIIKTILQHHDDYSRGCVFAASAESRADAFTKAEAIRELLTRIKDGMQDNKERDLFINAINSHVDSMVKMIFYKRSLNFEEDTEE